MVRFLRFGALSGFYAVLSLRGADRGPLDGPLRAPGCGPVLCAVLRAVLKQAGSRRQGAQLPASGGSSLTCGASIGAPHPPVAAPAGAGLGLATPGVAPTHGGTLALPSHQPCSGSRSALTVVPCPLSAHGHGRSVGVERAWTVAHGRGAVFSGCSASAVAPGVRPAAPHRPDRRSADPPRDPPACPPAPPRSSRPALRAGLHMSARVPGEFSENGRRWDLELGPLEPGTRRGWGPSRNPGTGGI